MTCSLRRGGFDVKGKALQFGRSPVVHHVDPAVKHLQNVLVGEYLTHLWLTKPPGAEMLHHSIMWTQIAIRRSECTFRLSFVVSVGQWDIILSHF